MAEAFNHMLDRLDDAFAQQRRFVSDASHELRSPAHRDPRTARGACSQRQSEHRGRAPGRSDDDEGDGKGGAAGRRPASAGPPRRGRWPGAARGTDRHIPWRSRRRGAAETTEAGELCGGTIRVDPDLLAQVIRNLLSNARRHAGPGGRGGVSRRGRERRVCIVTVDDDGPGIPPTERERVFDRFHRSEAARDRASGGSGLGLGDRPRDRRQRTAAASGSRSRRSAAPGSPSSCLASQPTMRDLSPNA